MHRLRICFLAATIGGTLLAGPAAAAPDKSGGVAFMSAVVAKNGALKRGSGAESAVRTVVGNYEVTFQRSIAACAWSVSIGEATPGGQIELGITYGFRAVANNRTVGVQTRNPSGSLADLPFHIIVFCAR